MGCRESVKLEMLYPDIQYIMYFNCAILIMYKRCKMSAVISMQNEFDIKNSVGSTAKSPAATHQLVPSSSQKITLSRDNELHYQLHCKMCDITSDIVKNKMQ
jgi:hypothetical protein